MFAFIQPQKMCLWSLTSENRFCIQWELYHLVQDTTWIRPSWLGCSSWSGTITDVQWSPYLQKGLALLFVPHWRVKLTAQKLTEIKPLTKHLSPLISSSKHDGCKKCIYQKSPSCGCVSWQWNNKFYDQDIIISCKNMN